MDLRVMQLYRSAPEWHEETPKGLSIRWLSKKEALKEGIREQPFRQNLTSTY